MRSHTQKFKFQEHFFSMKDPIFHRCGVCEAILLLDSDSIATHVKKGNMSHGMTKITTKIYQAHNQSKEKMKPKRSKKAELRRLNSYSANLLSAKSTDNQCKTKENMKKIHTYTT